MFKKPRNFKEEEIFDKFFCGKRFFSFSIYCKTWIVPKMVPETGLEPVQEVIPRDFKSLASTNSATPAEIRLKMEAPSGFEPEMEILQTSALPLG